MLKEKGIEPLVLEKSDKPGGLIKCDVVDGHLFHRVGGHVFNTKVEAVAEWFWSRFRQDQEFLKARRQAGIYMENRFLGYPFENYLYQLDETSIRPIFNEIIDLEKRGYKDPFSYTDFEAFLKGNFGQTLYELYFKPYNSKIWKTDLKTVALPWLEGKLPMPNYREMIMSNILRKEEGNMVHSTFFYPKENGSQAIANRLAESIKTLYNKTCHQIEFVNGQWCINGEYTADYLIFTGDIRTLDRVVMIESTSIKNQLSSLTNLKSNGTSNLLCETDTTSHSWLYLPEKTITAHRIIYTGNFSPANQPSDRRHSCTVEFSGQTSLEVMKEQIKLLPGNLKMIDYNYEANSYVIQQVGDRERIQQLKSDLAPYRFYLVGRFAEWEYHNMDKAIESAMGVVAGIND
jgi:protoporphyrinogen oxidase